MQSFLEGLGVEWPSWGDWVSAGAAGIVVFAAWLGAWLLGRWIGPRIVRWWERHAGQRGEWLVRSICEITRYLALVLALALVLNADPWRPLGALILGVA